jgi:flavin reductase (DIM6/NTAB) family NADH-FMN oxidoreductase RutF
MTATVDAQAMRNTLRLWASGVSVVTSGDAHERAGLTVSAFNSLSLDPPMILICLHKDSHAIPLIEKTGVFAVSILGDDQGGISDRFAGRVPLGESEDRFTGVTVYSAATGAPIIGSAIAWLDCRVASRHDGSTHWIYIGEVAATGTDEIAHTPLLYFDRAYRALEKVTVEN